MTTGTTPPEPAVLSSPNLDAACLPLVEQVRLRRIVAEADLRAIVPQDHSDPWAWLSCYGQLRAWLAAPKPEARDQADADALVLHALREAPIPVPGLDGIAVFPKSFATMLQLRILDAQLDRMTARLITMIGEGAGLPQIDGAIELSSAVTYAQGLAVWSWIHPGPGLPFDPLDAEPKVPDHVVNLTPADLLAIASAVNQFSASLAACQTLIDPVPSRDGGSRPSWAGFFEAVGASTHVNPRELAVTHSLGAVLARAYLAADRQRVRPDGEDA